MVLFTVPDAKDTSPTAMNSAGVIVGYYSPSGPANVWNGFVRDVGGTITRFEVAGAASTYVSSVNNAGTISGSYRDSAGNYHGYLRDARGKFTLFDVPGATSTVAGAINDLGEVIGSYAPQNRGFLRHADGIFTVFEIPGYSSVGPSSINDKGTIAGIAGTGYRGNGATGFVRERGGTTTLFTVPDSTGMNGVSINARGEIAGSYWDAQGNVHPYLREPSGHIITFLTNQYCASTFINEAGTIVGGCPPDGFVRQPGGAITPIGPPADCQGGVGPVGIDAAGAVGGFCLSYSGMRGFVYVP
jgi:hypothetical protein